MVDDNDPRPAYVQVADGLRESIRNGDLAPGQRLPSGRELAEQFGVALMTVQKAVDKLRSDGLVHSQRGRGVFVRAEGVEPPGDELAELRAAVADLKRRMETMESRADGTV